MHCIIPVISLYANIIFDILSPFKYIIVHLYIKNVSLNFFSKYFFFVKSIEHRKIDKVKNNWLSGHSHIILPFSPKNYFYAINRLSIMYLKLLLLYNWLRTYTVQYCVLKEDFFFFGAKKYFSVCCICETGYPRVLGPVRKKNLEPDQILTKRVGFGSGLPITR